MKNKGFTLIELVVAIGIFAFLSTILSQMFSISLNQVAVSKNIYNKVNTLRSRIMILERDFSYITITRSRSVEQKKTINGAEFVFYKSFASNPFNIYPRTNLSAFLYTLDPEQKILYRKHFDKLDSKGSLDEETYEISNILEGVVSFEVEFSEDSKTWKKEFNRKLKLKYIKFKIVFDDDKIIERIFSVFFYKKGAKQ